MSNEIIARNNWVKRINGSTYGETKQVEIRVKAELVKVGSNEFPYFSITGEIVKLDKRYRDPVITCGAIHTDILRHFPELAPLVLVHLSGPDGVPMHAEANARYFAGLCTYSDGSSMAEYVPSRLANHLQVSKEIAGEVYTGLSKGLPWDRVTQALGLVELWSKQAGEARALLLDVKVAVNA